ncbi:MAG: hypothetical protein AAGC85_21010 [Bacteroidota bacterium]
MKKDPITKLVKESKLETSDAFTELMMEKLDQQLEKKMRLKLYLLITGIAAFFAITTFVLITSGFTIPAFGLKIQLPKIFSMLIVTMGSFLAVLHLLKLVGISSSREGMAYN